MPSFRDFYFDSSTGKNSIHTRMCIPDDKARAVVQIMHGIAEYIDRYDDFMEFLASNGIVAVGTDHLGHGKSIRRPEEKGFFSDSNGWFHVVCDEEILRLAMKENYPQLPQIVFGHSMGSFMARTHLIRYPGGFDAAIISGTGNQGKALVTGGLAMGNLVTALRGAHHYSGFLNNVAFGSYNKIYDNPQTDYDWLTRDKDIVEKYIADPLCGFIPTCSLFRDMMSGISSITNQNNLELMDKDTPVYFMSGTMDPVGECGKGVNLAYNNFLKAGMKDVTIKLYPEGRHEMLNELNRD
ncbi:MAG: alpha/beta fold hydrolase, partial [Oscillospiraceae bacterium]|nr:alpha/beta fold hydrolase [Oscillospiraceae bacterium]